MTMAALKMHFPATHFYPRRGRPMAPRKRGGDTRANPRNQHKRRDCAGYRRAMLSHDITSLPPAADAADTPLFIQ